MTEHMHGINTIAILRHLTRYHPTFKTAKIFFYMHTPQSLLYLQRAEGVVVQIELHDVFEATVHYQVLLDPAQALAREVELSDLREPGVPDLVHQEFCG